MYYGFAEPVIIAGPRNAHLRPLIPPLAILFSSLLARAPSVSSPGHQLSFTRGPNQPSLAPRGGRRLFFSSPPYRPLTPGASSRRCAHSIIIIGFRSWTARMRAAPLSHSLSPFFIFIPSALRFPRRACLPTHLSLASRIPLLSITDGPAKRRWDDARANFSAGAPPRPPAQKTSRGGNLLPRRARANIRSCANSPRHDCIYL